MIAMRQTPIRWLASLGVIAFFTLPSPAQYLPNPNNPAPFNPYPFTPAPQANPYPSRGKPNGRWEPGLMRTKEMNDAQLGASIRFPSTLYNTPYPSANTFQPYPSVNPFFPAFQPINPFQPYAQSSPFQQPFSPVGGPWFPQAQFNPWMQGQNNPWGPQQFPFGSAQPGMVGPWQGGFFGSQGPGGLMPAQPGIFGAGPFGRF